MGTFAALEAEAATKIAATEPYVLEDVDPPIVITAPTDLERAVGLTELLTESGEFEIRDARRLLELFCGDAFPQVWQLLRRKHSTVMVLLVQQLVEHFKNEVTAAGDVPGGVVASPS